MSGQTNESAKKKTKPGILRLDIKKPRSSSRGSVEFSNETEMLGEVMLMEFCLVLS